MDGEEEEQKLSDIYGEVKGSHAQLGRIDERTQNMERQLQKIAEDVAENEQDINDLEDDVKRNSTIINGVTVGLSGLVLWIADKLGRFTP